MRRGEWRGVTLIAIALAAGVIAALAGGVVEDTLNWVFVGIPLVILLVGFAVWAYQRWHRRGAGGTDAHAGPSRR
jgi:hypothetical protein